MEMERINENTIRVLIENADLEERGITFLDLLGNHKQIENFFYSILEEVDIDEQFQETDAVTFQVLPNRNGLELFISKNMLIDEEGDLPELTELMNYDSFGDFVKNQHHEDDEASTHSSTSGSLKDGLDLDSPTLEAVIRFAHFEDLINLAQLTKFDNVITNLYRLSDEADVYYLHVLFYLEATSEQQVNDDLAVVLEYGTMTGITPEVLAEYGHLLMERSALEQTKHYFKK